MEKVCQKQVMKSLSNSENWENMRFHLFGGLLAICEVFFFLPRVSQFIFLDTICDNTHMYNTPGNSIGSGLLFIKPASFI